MHFEVAIVQFLLELFLVEFFFKQLLGEFFTLQLHFKLHNLRFEFSQLHTLFLLTTFDVLAGLADLVLLIIILRLEVLNQFNHELIEVNHSQVVQSHVHQLRVERVDDGLQSVLGLLEQDTELL